MSQRKAKSGTGGRPRSGGKRSAAAGRSRTAGASRQPARRAAARRRTGSPTPASTAAERRYEELLATNRRLKRKIFDLYTVFEISRNFNAVRDYHSLLDSFVYTCLGQLGAQRGAIFLKREAAGDAFYVAEAKGQGPLPSRDDRLMADSRLLEFLTRLNRPVPTAELLKDLADDNERRVLGCFAEGLVVPLIYQTRLSGIFVIADKLADGGFQPADVEFLSVLSNQIAVAIENARLYEAERMATRLLRQTQQQLVRTERLAALGEMSARVAHEVNNPLAIIKNYLVLIQRSAEGNDTVREYVEVVGQEIDRIAQIVRQLLDFHRPRPTQAIAFDLNRVLQQVLAFMERPLSSDNIRVERRLTETELTVSGQPQSLKQVFLNLVINARDAMPSGGVLTVGSERRDGQAFVYFRDTGPGIPPEHIPRIFEPFFSTKGPGEGTGLGLSVCYGIIKQHQGTIEFRNTEDGGCFEILLPLSEETPSDDRTD